MSIDNDIDKLVKELDKFGNSDTSRLKVSYSEDIKQGESQKDYHHGRCDVGSPWARGCSFDILED